MSELRGVAGRILFRKGQESDLDAIAAVETESYSSAGAGLSPALVAAPVDTLSHVALSDDRLVGHVLLTRVEGPDRALAMAPLAILPSWRDMQIGTELVRRALARSRDDGWRSVFVIGQPDYYCRFGFKSGLADPAISPWQGPRLLALELVAGALEGWTGPLAFPESYEAVIRATLPKSTGH